MSGTREKGTEAVEPAGPAKAEPAKAEAAEPAGQAEAKPAEPEAAEAEAAGDRSPAGGNPPAGTRGLFIWALLGYLVKYQFSGVIAPSGLNGATPPMFREYAYTK